MTLANSLDQDYKEFIELLNAHEVRYLVVGGYAVAYHGFVRYTADIDVWVEVAPENAARLVRVMRDFGFGSLYKEADFLEPGGIIQLGVAPVRIDILNEIDGVRFADCYAACETTTWDGVAINFISLADLRKNKASTGRLKDQLDLKNLAGLNS
ncbi:nucleotidyl transferase AbiEii/AbiGii toxin family protein [Hymenobacter fastidiosus]|uniref:Nucleotidyl transferase AbiEii/AbiGii toxin family protein n=1 Tax=Hymenobacter fastidiosus TaxID=486264 RepID=A0ABP7RMQ0_9BACT